MKKEKRQIVEDPHLKEEKIKKHMKNLGKELEGLFAFGKQVDIQKHLGWERRRRSG